MPAASHKQCDEDQRWIMMPLNGKKNKTKFVFKLKHYALGQSQWNAKEEILRKTKIDTQKNWWAFHAQCDVTLIASTSSPFFVVFQEKYL